MGALRRSAWILVVAFAPALATGAVLFQTNFDNATGLSVLGTADTAATFAYDYSAVGVPANPNDPGNTTALKLEANMSAGAANEIAVVTSGLSLTAPYQVTFDFWINANGPFPGGGSGSTEFGGGVVGHDGVTAGRNGASLMITGEGGSSYDWRLYKDTGLQYIASGQYDVASNNNWDTDLSTWFPAQSPPAAQAALYPNQTGQTNPGCGGFAWHTMTITVAGGLANFKVDGHSIGSIDPSIGNPVSISGEAGVIYADIYSSVSDNAAVSFGLFDNLVITDVPEPGTFILLGLGAVAALRRRRR